MAVVEVPAVVKGDCLRTLNVGKMPAAIDGLVKHVKAYELSLIHIFRGDPPRMAGGFQPPQQGKLLAAAQRII